MARSRLSRRCLDEGVLRLRLAPLITEIVLAALFVGHIAGATVFAVVVPTNILAFALLGMSMSLVAGHAGLLSLAHAAYAGVAGYAVVTFCREVSHDGLLQLVVFVLLGAMLLVIVRSPFGAALRGIWDNEPRMRSLGYPIAQTRSGSSRKGWPARPARICSTSTDLLDFLRAPA